MALEHHNPSFVPLRCRCGRNLRAKREQVGTEIRCWDCHEMVLVPMPNLRKLVVGGMYGRLLGACRGPTLYRTIAAASILALAMSIPTAGLGVASLLLIVGVSYYGEMIRRGDVLLLDAPASRRTLPRPRSLVEALICIFLVAGFVVPLWVLHAGPARSPHLDRAGLAAFASTWILLPSSMLMIHAKGEGQRAGFRRLVSIVRHHPRAFLASILIVPLGLALTEAGLDLLFSIRGVWAFFALEHMPIPGNPARSIRVHQFDPRDYRYLPPGPFIRGYFDGLRHGYSFIGAIPSSLSLPTRAGATPAILRLLPFGYAIARFSIVTFILTCLLITFSIQARWLVLLLMLEQPSRQDRPPAGAQLPRPL